MRLKDFPQTCRQRSWGQQGLSHSHPQQRVTAAGTCLQWSVLPQGHVLFRADLAFGVPHCSHQLLRVKGLFPSSLAAVGGLRDAVLVLLGTPADLVLVRERY